MSELPVDVIVDILSRLPVKPLLRFRCISKSWHALIDSPDFIKLHLNRSVETNTNRSIIFRDCGLHSIDFDSLDDDPVELVHPLKNGGGFEVVGSCDGLLCLCYSEKDITLWNPSTRKHHKLPITPIEFPLECGSINHFIIYGFGYDSVSDDYKVVRLIEYYDRYYDSLGSEVKVYSLKLNSWRRIQDFPYSFRTWGVNAVLASGALHWAVYQITEGSLIAAFDLGVEEFRFMPQPDYLDKNGEIFLEVLGGCLCIVSYHVRTCDVDIWVMMEYGVKESWTRLIYVAQPSFLYMRPLAYSKSGGEVLVVEDCGRLLEYDLKTKTIKNIEILGTHICLGSHTDVHVCFGSLVPLRVDDEISKQKDEVKKKRRKIEA
ncbi:F-box protein CPR1-like [Cornus florida]|uniref:F-box protein CPR1-like n=1 Tax=Cornus florida TaxID=4283 RepID=UPI002898B497|nr:F-box protein CPR1-like [Cornus florida]